MASFIDPQNGDLATAEHVAQLVEDFQGLRNIPISLSGINDAATYALTLKNAGTGSRDLIAYAADGTTVLLQVDATGVTLGAPVNVPPGSISGTAISAGSITNAMLGADVARDNQLTNGGFEIWQRGSGPFSTPGPVFTADRWVINGSGATLSISRNTANVDAASTACAAITVTAWTGELYLTNTPEHLKQLLGRTISLSLRVRTSTPNAVRAVIATDVGPFAYSGYHTGGGAYETLTATALIASNVTILSPSVAFGANSTVYVDNAMLVVGSQAANYVPMHPADDLARCLRYYETVAEDLNLTGYGAAVSAPAQWYMNYKARKAVAATVTKVGTWTPVINCGQPTIVGTPSISGFNLATVVTAVGSYQFVPGAGNFVSAEANP
jgi:hypothetical protein